MKTFLTIVTLLATISSFANESESTSYWDTQINKAYEAAMASYSSGEREVLSPVQKAKITLSAELVFCKDAEMQSDSCRGAIRSAMEAGLSEKEIELIVKPHIVDIKGSNISEEEVSAMINQITK